jgi:hypothetical protein
MLVVKDAHLFTCVRYGLQSSIKESISGRVQDLSPSHYFDTYYVS